MSELHLKQPRFTYRAYGRFTKHRERIKKIKETGNLKYIYKNEWDKVCFAHDAAFFDDKDLTKTTISDKTLKDRAYEIAINPICDGYQRGLASILYRFCDKKTGSVARINEEPAQELHKPMIKKMKRRKVYARFKDNIWAVDLAEMGSLSSKNWGIKYLLCVVDVFIKYTCLWKIKNLKQFFIVLLK